MLRIDIETYSETSLADCGVYKYVADPSFEIMLFAYAYEDNPVQVVDLTRGEKIPEQLLDILDHSIMIKEAHNATFERICLSKYLGYPINPNSWRCSMVKALSLGLPPDLATLGSALKIDKQKLTEGKRLIQKFCVPHYKKDGTKYRIRPEDAPEDWELFKSYNIRDVEAEREISKRLHKIPDSYNLWEDYVIDQHINDYGVGINVDMARNAVDMSNRLSEKLTARCQKLTGLDNPNSVAQLKSWLKSRNVEVDSLNKESVKELVKMGVPDDVLEVLTIRQILGKSSVTKYQKMLDCEVYGRAHGLIQFYGASRTGRYAGRLIQVQNLPRNDMATLDEARNLVLNKDLDTLELLYDNPSQTLSELIRTAFVPKNSQLNPNPCNTFSVADYSAIEARVLAWLSGEQWVLDAFTEGKDIYCETASMMFKVPVVKHGINGVLRSKGKVAVLACGYGGGAGALEAFGADKMGMSPEEMQDTVTKWREANSNSVKFWWDVDTAVKNAIKKGLTSKVGFYKNIEIGMEKGFLYIQLPSTRRIYYPQPQIGSNKFGGESVTYMGMLQTKHLWCRLESYGPKFVENIVQATARDLLANGLDKAYRRLLHPVMHIHDEIVAETDDLDKLIECMEDKPEWAEGLPLRADGYKTPYYKKD